MTTIGVIYKQENELIANTAKQVIKDLKELGYKVGLKGAKFVLSLGGDGTILRAAHLVAKSGIPILGVHMGGLGFLSEIYLADLSKALEQIKNNDFKLDERAMLQATIAEKSITALNDIVICKSGIARVTKLKLAGIAEYTADGLIFSTATGSTAYNLSSGGPLLTPQSSSFVISAICAHSINTRPIVMDRAVEVVLTRGSDVILTSDGQHMVPVKEGQKIKIERAKIKTKLIRLKGYDFFKRVKEAFGFGPAEEF